MSLSEQVRELELENARLKKKVNSLESDITSGKQILSLYESMVAAACATLKLIEREKKNVG